MKEPGTKRFLTGVLLRRRLLRAFAVEGLKFSLWFIAFLTAFVVVRYLCGGGWVRGDGWEAVGVAVGLIALWLVSAVRTISAGYREFNEKG